MIRPRLLINLSCALSAVAAGTPAHLTLINATPYQWTRSFLQAHSLNGWDAGSFPPTISPGVSHTVDYSLLKDAASIGDVVYSLVKDGSVSTQSFKLSVQGKDPARSSRGWTINGTFSKDLTVANHRSDGKPFTFGEHNVSLVTFSAAAEQTVMHGQGDSWILAGDDNVGFVSEDPPTAWMDFVGDALKELRLTQLVLPASHDSGMSRITSHGGIAANTETQSLDIYSQLVSGIRWMDWRPYIDGKDKSYQLGHFTDVFGGFGQSLSDAMSDVNRFIEDHPGEMIVLNMYDGFDYLHDLVVRQWSTDEYDKFTDTLKKSINGLTTVYDLTASDSAAAVAGETLRTFYAKNKSPVIVRIEVGHIPKDRSIKVMDNQITGLMSSDQLPDQGSYADTDSIVKLLDDQLAKLKARKPDKLFKTTFTLTQQVEEVIIGPSIKVLAHAANAVMHANVFAWSSACLYPNEIEFDEVHNKQMAAMAIAMNMNFALNSGACKHNK